MSTFPAVRHLSVSIDRSPNSVYAFAADPKNLPRWAKGLSGGIKCIDGEWIADSPMGKVTVRFTPENPYGVLDHDVTMDSGVTVHNPLRVVANQSGSEVVFTLFQRPGMADTEFDADAEAVARDLAVLKHLLESER